MSDFDREQVANSQADGGPVLAIESTTLARLRKKFLVWGVAIASSLTTSGAVTLAPSTAWAQEEPAATEKDDEGKKEGFDPSVFSKLLASKEFDKAGELLDAAIAENPDDPRFVGMSMSLAVNLLRTDATAAQKRLTGLHASLLARKDLDTQSTMAISSSVLYLMQMKDLTVDEKLAIADQSLEKVKSLETAASDMAAQNILTSKCRLLSGEDRHEEAKAIMDGVLASARDAIDPDDTASTKKFIMLASTYGSTLNSSHPDAVQEVYNEANTLALKQLESDEAGVAEFATFYSLNSSRSSLLSYSDPKQASQLLDSIGEQLESLTERLDEDAAKGLSRYESMLASSRSRMAAALAREALIGTEAPALDAAHFVAMDSVSMDDLKGKVVLLDFWAVWCGPCIATFPHLTEWHEKYSDKGLTIIGVTKFYGYSWDEEAGRATRAETPPEPEVELAMLERFRESYELHHGFVVTPKDSEYSQAFQVTGIPQAVLLDKEGKIRMIKVGSGEANAKALEAEIESLLGVE